MESLRQKVTSRLSRLLSDSSPSHASPQASSCSKGGNPLSSFFSYINLSPNGIGQKIKKAEDDFKPNQSNPVKGTSGSVSCDGENLNSHVECFPAFEQTEPSIHLEEHETPVTARSTCFPEMFEDAVESHVPENPMPNLMEDSSFLTVELYEFLQSSIPNIVKGCQWLLLYSTLKHGISLRTLIRKSSELSGPCLLIAGDKKGAVFGGLLDCPLKPSPKRKYQGTNQTFVFTTTYGAPRLFRPTGKQSNPCVCCRCISLCLLQMFHFAQYDMTDKEKESKTQNEGKKMTNNVPSNSEAPTGISTCV